MLKLVDFFVIAVLRATLVFKLFISHFRFIQLRILDKATIAENVAYYADYNANQCEIHNFRCCVIGVSHNELYYYTQYKNLTCRKKHKNHCTLVDRFLIAHPSDYTILKIHQNTVYYKVNIGYKQRLICNMPHFKIQIREKHKNHYRCNSIKYNQRKINKSSDKHLISC